jgi:phospholipid/cholesterol/gamma-HCH transport system permease protein
MAADIGTMKVTEQVDALRVMGVHPVDYLVLPRFLAMMISMPFLVAEAISFGLIASYAGHEFRLRHALVMVHAHMIDHTNMGHRHRHDQRLRVRHAHHPDLLPSGLAAENGAVGVGLGTTRAVVISSLVLLIVNFFLSILLNYIWPLGNSV